jgi:hypothetical protein
METYTLLARRMLLLSFGLTVAACEPVDPTQAQRAPSPVDGAAGGSGLPESPVSVSGYQDDVLMPITTQGTAYATNNHGYSCKYWCASYGMWSGACVDDWYCDGVCLVRASCEEEDEEDSCLYYCASYGWHSGMSDNGWTCDGICITFTGAKDTNRCWYDCDDYGWRYGDCSKGWQCYGDCITWTNCD